MSTLADHPLWGESFTDPGLLNRWHDETYPCYSEHSENFFST